jgi:phosphinothricin acetyltransferase
LHERQAFAYSVEDSVYLHHEWQGRGIGSLILQELLRLAEQIGYHTVLGAISGDQSASIALHEKFGFIQTSKLREVGYKFDRWLDVVWVQKML